MNTKSFTVKRKSPIIADKARKKLEQIDELFKEVAEKQKYLNIQKKSLTTLKAKCEKDILLNS